MKVFAVMMRSLALLIILANQAIAADDTMTMAPPGAKAYIIAPLDGQTVPQTFRVIFGLSAMGVAPSGVNKDNTGHHHLLIDVDKLPDLTQPLPATDHIKHFGGGQTETELTLAPGEHTLQLLLGNHAHIPHDPPVLSKKITVVVE